MSAQVQACKGLKLVVADNSPYTWFKPGVTAVITDAHGRAVDDPAWITVRADDHVDMPAELKTLNRTVGITLEAKYFIAVAQ